MAYLFVKPFEIFIVWHFFCFFYGRGPLCLLRFELGVLTNGRLGTVEMVSEYIKHDQAEEVLVNE